MTQGGAASTGTSAAGRWRPLLAFRWAAVGFYVLGCGLDDHPTVVAFANRVGHDGLMVGQREMDDAPLAWDHGIQFLRVAVPHRLFGRPQSSVFEVPLSPRAVPLDVE